jgi:hypothetical protein
MKTEKIAAIKKRFHREWLLIELDEVDESTTTPISGKLLFHSPHRYEVYSRLLSLHRRKAVLVENSADSLPKGYAAAF